MTGEGEKEIVRHIRKFDPLHDKDVLDFRSAFKKVNIKKR